MLVKDIVKQIINNVINNVMIVVKKVNRLLILIEIIYMFMQRVNIYHIENLNG